MAELIFITLTIFGITLTARDVLDAARTRRRMSAPSPGGGRGLERIAWTPSPQPDDIANPILPARASKSAACRQVARMTEAELRQVLRPSWMQRIMEVIS